MPEDPGCDGGRKGQSGPVGASYGVLRWPWLDALSVSFGSERHVGTTFRRALSLDFSRKCIKLHA